MSTAKTSLGFTPADGHLYWRDLFKDFFAAKGCKPIASDRLVPENDPSLLFTGAGMNQFKDDFTGILKHGTRAATTSQKCMRTPDLENVGKTQRHHTFFEMLGFFSFGDKLTGPDGSVGFFKHEAIGWIWEFYTSPKFCGLDPKRIRVTIYKSPEGVIDQEAYDRWAEIFNAQGLPHVKNGWIYGLGENDNFWPAGCPSKGPNGVCGPCSEIFWDLGEQYNDPKLDGTDCPENNGARFMELGNIVFTQFERSGPTPGKGVLTPLPQKNIDFGGGFERLVMVKEGAARTLDTSLFMPVRNRMRELLGKTPSGESEMIRERRIADHLRAAGFLIGDGVSPSNEKQGYILRRILRRAYRDGVKLGFSGPFLHKLVSALVETYGRAFPDIEMSWRVIAATIQREEEDFDRILARGLERLDGLIEGLTGAGVVTLSGEAAFDLHSTFGLPIDVTRDVLNERGLDVDEEGFEAAFKSFRALSRKTARFSADVFDKGWFNQTKRITKQSGFLGYDCEEAEGRVMAIIQDGEMVSEITSPDYPMPSRGDSDDDEPNAAEQAATFTIVLDRTPFYGESGGQVGDTGVLMTSHGRFKVRDTQKKEGYVLHVGHMVRGILKVGDTVSAKVDSTRRALIRANHSATHLMHSALRQVLGDHVHQKGSMVNDQILRFDFSHPQKVTPEEIAEIERRVNAWILSNDEVKTDETTPDEAREAGALMFFGEKYGEKVRMLTMGGNSKELCGGTHASRTGDIGSFRIISESSVASGVRRIEAITGLKALEAAHTDRRLVSDLSLSLKVSPDQIPNRIKALMDEIRDLKQAKGKAQKAAGPSAELAFESIAGNRVLIQLQSGATMGELLTTKDALMQDEGLAAVLLAGDGEGKASMVLALSQRMVAKGLDAGPMLGDIIKLVDGRGGGKKHMAQAGGKAPEKLPDALAYGRKRLEESLAAMATA